MKCKSHNFKFSHLCLVEGPKHQGMGWRESHMIDFSCCISGFMWAMIDRWLQCLRANIVFNFRTVRFIIIYYNFWFHCNFFSCWLSTKDGFIWAFIGPVIVFSVVSAAWIREVLLTPFLSTKRQECIDSFLFWQDEFFLLLQINLVILIKVVKTVMSSASGVTGPDNANIKYVPTYTMLIDK